MKTFLLLLLLTTSVDACPFEVGTKVVTPDGEIGTVVLTQSDGADAEESAVVRLDTGELREYSNQPGIDDVQNDLCTLQENAS